MHDTFLYANGDSFVEGCELGDFLISSHPGYYNFNNRRPQQFDSWLRQSNDGSTDIGKERIHKEKLIKQEEYKRNFASKLQQQLGVEYKNNAKGGSSFERIIRTSLIDLIEISKTKKNIVALIGTSEPRRISIPAPVNDDLWMCATMNTTNDAAKPIMDYHLAYFNDYHALLLMYKNIILMQEFCKSNGIKLLWIAGNSDITEETITHSEIKCLMEYSKFKYTLSLPEIARQIDAGAMAPGYHFSEIVHTEAASRLLDKL
jgi:hypothetical protein